MSIAPIRYLESNGEDDDDKEMGTATQQQWQWRQRHTRSVTIHVNINFLSKYWIKSMRQHTASNRKRWFERWCQSEFAALTWKKMNKQNERTSVRTKCFMKVSMSILLPFAILWHPFSSSTKRKKIIYLQ